MLFYKGFAKQNRGDSVKLHATLINTRLRSEVESEIDGGRGAGGYKGRQSINAKQLLEVNMFILN